MSTSRRDFLKKGTVLALATGVPLGIAEKIAGSERVKPSVGFGLTRAAFQAHLNTDFLIEDGDSKVTLKLTEIEDLGSRRNARQGKEAFSLLFKGDHSTPLNQKTYLIHHESLGIFSFLIVPVMSRDKRSLHYEAIVNRLNP